ncbi:MAG: branched-chain amino acid ABC transporter permease [Desulfobacterales bacterium]|nr:branched-chain amino acid ABC transporter permease [Desulfobacterales bacterium]
MYGRAQKIIYAVFVIAVIILGWSLDNEYYLQLLIFIGLNTLLALSLNMLMGYAGQISLGHAAFYGIGAYVTAILTTTYNVEPILALPAAVGAAMIVAWIVGIPTLRLSGYYLGMGTLGFGMIIHILFREWSSVTGGASGFVGIPPLEIGPLIFDSRRSYFFLVWGVVLLSIIMCRRIIDSRVGRALRSIHDGEKAAAAIGVDTKKLKVQVFVLSAAMAAMAGFLYAHLIYFISPGTFNFVASIRIVTMVVIGGMASIWGALFGASLLTLLPEWLHAFSEFEMVVYGLILMSVMIFLPRGLTRGVIDIYYRYRKSHDK